MTLRYNVDKIWKVEFPVVVETRLSERGLERIEEELTARNISFLVEDRSTGSAVRVRKGDAEEARRIIKLMREEWDR